MTQANQKIRRTAAGAGVKLWQIATLSLIHISMAPAAASSADWI